MALKKILVERRDTTTLDTDKICSDSMIGWTRVTPNIREHRGHSDPLFHAVFKENATGKHYIIWFSTNTGLREAELHLDANNDRDKTSRNFNLLEVSLVGDVWVPVRKEQERV